MRKGEAVAPPALPLITRRLIEINYEDVQRAASYRTHLALLITCSDFNYTTTTLACFSRDAARLFLYLTFTRN